MLRAGRRIYAFKEIKLTLGNCRGCLTASQSTVCFPQKERTFNLNNLKKALLEDLLRYENVTYVDVGARDLSPHFFRSCPELIHFVGVEPEKEEAKKLTTKPPVEWKSFYLSDKGLSVRGGPKTLWVTPNPGSSSTKKPLLSYAEKYNRFGAFTASEKQSIYTQTIEDLLKSSQASGGLVFKLDIEGSELDVLRGLKKSAKRLLLVKTEVSFQRIRGEQSMPSDMLSLMDELGFDLVRISDVDDLRFAGDQSTFPMRNTGFSSYPIYSRGDVGTAEFLFLRRFKTVTPELHQAFAAVCVEVEQFDKAAEALKNLANQNWSVALFKCARRNYQRRILFEGLNSLKAVWNTPRNLMRSVEIKATRLR